jgi:hypothetical protein
MEEVLWSLSVDLELLFSFSYRTYFKATLAEVTAPGLCLKVPLSQNSLHSRFFNQIA